MTGDNRQGGQESRFRVPGSGQGLVVRTEPGRAGWTGAAAAGRGLGWGAGGRALALGAGGAGQGRQGQQVGRAEVHK